MIKAEISMYFTLFSKFTVLRVFLNENYIIYFEFFEIY